MQNSVEIYDSANRPHPLIEELLAVVKYRDLIYQFVSRAIKTRYKRSALGVLWTMLNPLLSSLVLALVFSKFFRFNIEHYAVYVLSGMTLWNFFASTTRESMGQMIWSGALLNRIYVPKSVFVVAAIGTGLVNLLIAVAIILVIAMGTGLPPKPALLALPFAILLLSIFCLGVGLFLASAAVYFADILPVYDVILTIWMYATPTFYPVEIILDLAPTYAWLFKLNPLFHFIQLFRDPIFYGTVPNWPVWFYSTVFALVALVVGGLVFAVKSHEYAYRV